MGSRLGCRVILSSGDHCLVLSLMCLVLVVVICPFACVGFFLGFLGGNLILRGIVNKGFAAREGGAFPGVIVSEFLVFAL